MEERKKLNKNDVKVEICSCLTSKVIWFKGMQQEEYWNDLNRGCG